MKKVSTITRNFESIAMVKSKRFVTLTDLFSFKMSLSRIEGTLKYLILSFLLIHFFYGAIMQRLCDFSFEFSESMILIIYSISAPFEYRRAKCSICFCDVNDFELIAIRLKQNVLLLATKNNN